MVTEKSQGLFHRAILQAPILSYVGFNKLIDVKNYSSEIAKEVLGCGVNDLNCLRNLPEDQFTRFFKPKYVNPVYSYVILAIDGEELEEVRLKLLHRIDPQIQIIIGISQFEGSVFVTRFSSIDRLEQHLLRTNILDFFTRLTSREQAEQIVKAYR